MSELRRSELPQSALDAERGYVIHSFATRFSDPRNEPGGMAALRRAAEHGDIEWRRAVAAALPDFPVERAAAIARLLANDLDPSVSAMARRCLG